MADNALFCLEVYVHRIEKLPKRLRSNPPALAVRFLDYAPLVVEPPPDAVADATGRAWYGAGKRCVFEAEEAALAKKLRARAADAVLVHAVERGGAPRRRQYGSATLALAGFADGAADGERGGEAPLGAVRTWGRVECLAKIENAHGRGAGVATLSVSLASLDPCLRRALHVGGRLPETRRSVDAPVGDAGATFEVAPDRALFRASGAAAERTSCPLVLIFAIDFKRTTPACRRCKDEQARCPYGRETGRSSAGAGALAALDWTSPAACLPGVETSLFFGVRVVRPGIAAATTRAGRRPAFSRRPSRRRPCRRRRRPRRFDSRPATTPPSARARTLRS